MSASCRPPTIRSMAFLPPVPVRVHWLLLLGMGLIGVACGHAAAAPATPTAGAVASASRAAPAPTRPSAAAAPPTSAPSPSAVRPARIFMIVMENKEFGSLIGNPRAPYINRLAAQFALGERYYAVGQPSLPNYLALLGGDTFGVTSDCTDCLLDRPNLVDALEARGRSWTAYMEGVPGPCYLKESAGGRGSYAMKHNPFAYFQDIRRDPARCGRVVPLGRFAGDLSGNRLADFVWITPNLVNDMHDGSVAAGDRWLATFVPPILASDAWRHDGLLLIVWDEGTTDRGCCGQPGGGHVPLLVVAPNDRPGRRLTTPSNHFGLLRTLEDLWGLDRLGRTAGADVAPIPDLLPPAVGS